MTNFFKFGFIIELGIIVVLLIFLRGYRDNTDKLQENADMKEGQIQVLNIIATKEKSKSDSLHKVVASLLDSISQKEKQVPQIEIRYEKEINRITHLDANDEFLLFSKNLSAEN